MSFKVGDLVSILLPDLSRPLYGEVVAVSGGKLTVRVESERGIASIEIPESIARPWYQRR